MLFNDVGSVILIIGLYSVKAPVEAFFLRDMYLTAKVSTIFGISKEIWYFFKRFVFYACGGVSKVYASIGFGAIVFI